MKWAMKLGAKVLLSKLPIPYSFWKTLGIFKHGNMDNISYSFNIFNIHLNEFRKNNNLLNPNVILELGCGDSVASAVIAASHGIEKIYIIDKGSFACKDISFYKKLTIFLKESGLNPPVILEDYSFDDVLKICNASYLTSGLKSLNSIKDGEIDFIYSHSVLEHVRKSELAETLAELYRITKLGGSASHTIDYQDHLSKALNNLRFPENIWESNIFASSGFYTNRVPAVTLHKLFASTGFNIIAEQFGKWPELPTPRSQISKEFNSYSNNDLLNRTSSIFLKKIKFK